MKPVKDAGEFNLIRRIRAKTRVDRTVLAGIGDDTAILKTDPSKELLFTTDMIIQDKHFRLKDATAYEIGRKALAVNLSDIAAMGGIPRHAVVSIGFPGDLSQKFVTDLYEGIRVLARKFHVNLVGGDTNASEKLVISIALLGECEKSKAVQRSGAKLGDVIFVSGELGGSYRSKKHVLFMPRIEEAQFLVKNFKLGAMMDISDGLAGDIHRIAEESRVGALLCREAVPVSKAASGFEAALTDGEDFELLFTLSPREAARLHLSPFQIKTNFFKPVGKIVEKKYGVCLVDTAGISKSLAEHGFDHFK